MLYLGPSSFKLLMDCAHFILMLVAYVIVRFMVVLDMAGKDLVDILGDLDFCCCTSPGRIRNRASAFVTVDDSRILCIC
jgi:hypothetical protein